MTDWTGASWVFSEGPDAGQEVTITGTGQDRVFGKVWVGKLTNGKRVIFTYDRLKKELDPKTRRPKARHCCA